MTEIPRELAQDSRQTLRLLERVTLGDEAWSTVERCLDELEQALERGEAGAVDAVIGELELFGAHRVATRIDIGVVNPPPPTVREHLNRIVHDLDSRLGSGDD